MKSFLRTTPQKEPLQQAEDLFWQGKPHEALEQLGRLRTKEDVTDTEWLKGQLLKCRIIANQDVMRAQGVLNRVIKMSQELDLPLIRVDALLVMTEAWLELGKLDTSKTFFDQGKVILANIPSATASDLAAREATLLALEGGFYTYKGELERAFECLQQSLTLREQLGNSQAIAHSLFYLGWAHIQKGEFECALELLQQSLRIREQLQHPKTIANSLFYLGRTYMNTGEMERSLEYFQKSLELSEQLGNPHEIAWSLSWCGVVFMYQGELERASEVLQNSLAICEQLGIPGTFAEALSLHCLGFVYMQKGELEYALEYLQKSLALEEERGLKTEFGWNLAYIGIVHLTKGHLEEAFEYLEKSLEVREEVGTAFDISHSLIYLLLISLELGNLEPARHYVYRLEVLREKTTSKLLDQAYHLAQAMLLKASPRVRDQMKAQELFQQIEKEKVIWLEWTVLASLNLCELLFLEFKFSENPEILHEVQAVTHGLLELAKAQHSHLLRAETYLLQAKLALLDLDMARARRLLTQAQGIADDKGLQRLAMSISHEHDALLDQLNQWEDLMTQEASLAQAGEFAGVEEMLSQMMRKRAIEPPEIQPEEPVLLLILAEGGLALYSHPFVKTRQLKEQLIGGFLTSLSAFGQDALAASGSIDRIMYEDYTVAVKALEDLLFCYIFQGPSYLALKKLEQFMVHIREDAVQWHILGEARKIRRALAPNTLQVLIAEVFQS